MSQKGKFETLTGGGFVSGHSFLHRVNPGTKLIVALVLLGLIAFANGMGLMGLAVTICLGLRFSQYPAKEFLKNLKPFFWFLLVVGLFPVLVAAGTFFDGFRESSRGWEAMIQGATSLGRVVLMFSISSLLIRTTPIHSLVRQVEKFFDGFPWFGSLGRDIVIVGGLAVQFLPHLGVQGERWVSERLEKEADQFKGGWFSKTRRIARLLGPWVVSVLRDIDELADSSGFQHHSNS